MKKYILLLLFIPLLIFGQGGYFIHNDVISDYDDNFGYSVSDADSVFFYLDTLWIAGDDSIDIFIPQAKSLGMIKIKGTVTGTKTLSTTRHGVDTTRAGKSGNATIAFLIGPHNGNGSTDNAEITFSPDTLGSFTHTAASGDSTTGFSYYPLEAVSTLKDEATLFWTLRLVGTAGDLAGIWFEIEYLNAY